MNNESNDVVKNKEDFKNNPVLPLEDYDLDELKKKDEEESKQQEILLAQFQNISRYMEDDSLYDNNQKSTLASWVDYIIDDFELSKINDSRLQFYMEFIKILKKDPKLLKQIIYLNNKIKLRKKKEKKLIKQLSNVLRNISSANQDKKNKLENLQSKIMNDYNIQDQSQYGGKKYMNSYLNIPPDTEETKSDNVQIYDPTKLLDLFKKDNGKSNMKKEDTVRGYLGYKYNLDNISKLNQNIFKDITQDKFKQDQNSIQEFIEDYYKAHNNNDQKTIRENLRNAVDKLESSPEDVVKTLKITREDRYIFILVTFFIRYVTVLLVQWCIDINIVTSFYQGFLFYAFIYIIIFWFLVMFININNMPYATYVSNTNIGSIRSLFYYFYMGTNGISRLLTHTALILILLFIPILLNLNHNNTKPNTKKKTNDEKPILSYEDKKNLIKSLSLFTIFMWVMTSIISMKY